MKNKSGNKNIRNKEQLKAEINKWTEIIKVKPKQVRFQNMKLKWASCSPKGWVSFSTKLFQEPRSFQEYVIVHELLHLQAPNHGRLFKSLLNAYLPGWEEALKNRNESSFVDKVEMGKILSNNVLYKKFKNGHRQAKEKKGKMIG